VEAPVSGSIILAGVLLKLGGFGIYRFLYIIISSSIKLSSYFYGLRIVGIILIRFICCRLNDIKALVAYSSVAHIALVISRILGYYSIGIIGSLIIIVGHGISSSGLFCILNIIYEKTSSRRIYLNKGILRIIPLFSFIFFILCISNISAPPTLNLLAELIILIRVIKFSLFIVIIFPLGSFIGAVFTLYIFSISQHGKNYSSIYSFLRLTGREIHVIIIHVILLNLLILLSVYFF
jgi:NADH-ubiquinone oxidoreductase chain 4